MLSFTTETGLDDDFLTIMKARGIKPPKFRIIPNTHIELREFLAELNKKLDLIITRLNEVSNG